MRKKIEPSMLQVPEDILAQWQSMVNVMVELAGIPAGLIMRIAKEDIEVFLASQGNGNPYHPGDREHLVGSGLYCETVIRTKQPLLIVDALADPKWRNNPDVKLNMISYLGFPILLPDNTPFGTICILDIRANVYSDTIQQLIEKFRNLIEAHLELLYMNTVLGEKNRHLSEYLDELQSLKGLIQICTSCKKIKDSKGYWNSVDKYLVDHPEANFTHGYCPECYKKAVDEIENS
jgi:GAF domain-containing protein